MLTQHLYYLGLVEHRCSHQCRRAICCPQTCLAKVFLNGFNISFSRRFHQIRVCPSSYIHGWLGCPQLNPLQRQHLRCGHLFKTFTQLSLEKHQGGF
eukprot:XP_001705669.1 Hypothetical protein GL50803_88373 [Giardia lamblia ATCC 50803]